MTVNGPYITGEEGHATFYNKVIMNDALEVSGAITMGGMSVITTDVLNQSIGSALLLSQGYTDSNLAAYQPKLLDPSDTGRNLLRPDGVTLLAIEEDQFIKITPTFSIINDVATNYRLKIGITNEFANQVIDATNDIATLQTTKLDASSTTSWDETRGQIFLNGSIGNYIAWNPYGVAPPAFSTRSIGTKLVLNPGLSAGSVDFGFGIDSNTLWYSAGGITSGHRWYCATTQVMNLTTAGLVVAGPIYQRQPAQTTLGASTTLTIAWILTGILQVSVNTASTLTLPTGTLTHRGMMGGDTTSLLFDQGFEWSIINSGNATTTVAPGDGHSTTGQMAVSVGTSGRFLTRIWSKDTATTYRLC
jgi:hypothetical protein